MNERYAIFGPGDDGILMVGCLECDVPLFDIDLTEGPDVPVGELLREHEVMKHRALDGGGK